MRQAIVLVVYGWVVVAGLFGCAPRLSPELAQCRDRPDRFTRYDNGTVLDTCTQLTWMTQDYRNIERKAPTRWLIALAWADKMNQRRYGEHSDWRVATLEDYKVIYKSEKNRQSYRGKLVGYPDAFADGGGEWYWVEEVAEYGSGHIHQAYTFSFRFGLQSSQRVHTDAHPQTEYGLGSIRLVRGPPAS